MSVRHFLLTETSVRMPGADDRSSHVRCLSQGMLYQLRGQVAAIRIPESRGPNETETSGSSLNRRQFRSSAQLDGPQLPRYCAIVMPSGPRFANLRSIFPPVTTTALRTVTIPKPSAMSSALATDIGLPEDVQNWRRQISPKASPHWVYTNPIQKSQQDDREYRLIRLDNGLQAMLVHDAKADKAAASLDVAVGHLHDPVSTHLRSWVYQIGITDTWHYNRMTCQGSRISASIYCSWCLLRRTGNCTTPDRVL